MTEEMLAKLRKKIDRALDSGAHPIAAFDADGTLWDMDMGEHFFQYQISKKLLPDLPADPWGYYREFHDRDPKAAFLWLAQINKGVPLSTVREWALAARNEVQKIPIFPGIRSVIDHLHRKNVQVYIVTASIKWAVEPAAELLGIAQDKVLGITTKTIDGLVTEKQDGPITWQEGKVEGLMAATGRKTPFLTAGNTMGDLALLDCATHLRIVNAAAPQNHPNYETEQALVEVAKKRGWIFHKYNHD